MQIGKQLSSLSLDDIAMLAGNCTVITTCTETASLAKHAGFKTAHVLPEKLDSTYLVVGNIFGGRVLRIADIKANGALYLKLSVAHSLFLQLVENMQLVAEVEQELAAEQRVLPARVIPLRPRTVAEVEIIPPLAPQPVKEGDIVEEQPELLPMAPESPAYTPPKPASAPVRNIVVTLSPNRGHQGRTIEGSRHRRAA